MMQDNLDNQIYLEKENTIDIKKEIGYYLFFWPWFLGATVLAVMASFLFLRTADVVYESRAQLQIKKTETDPSSFLTGGIDIFGLEKVNVENDIAVITSQHILSQVVTRLDLQTTLYTVGRINEFLRYNFDYPISFKFKESNKAQDWKIDISNEIATIYNDSLSYNFKKGEIFNKEGMIIEISDSLFSINQNYRFTRNSIDRTIEDLNKSLIVTPASKLGEIVNLKFEGTNLKRSKSILNTMMQVLAEDQVNEKRKISRVSIDFIEERLKGLTKSIDTISQNTIAFQMASGIYDPAIQTGNALSTIIKGQEEVFGIGIQIEIATALLEKLEKQANYQILPANIGIENESVNSLLNTYNEVVTQRNNLLASTTVKSPVVLQLSSQLDNAKQAIITGVDRYIEGLQTSLKSFKQMEVKTRGEVAGLPSKENTLRAFARNFKIVEELYVFLLQRKEEASISFISALPNIKVLSFGVSSKDPISPNKKIFYLFAISLGFIIPFGILYLLKILDTKINTREDLEEGLPGLSILGEVPLDENYTNEYDDRGIIAESTRVIRSNMSFLLKETKSQVILTTSTTKGEGKSFVSYNIAKSYNSLGKKVLLIGADLRNPQVHNLLGIERGNLGLSTFLNNVNYNDIDKLIVKAKSTDEMDFLLSGAIPPNPSELLMRPRMKELLEILKPSYDIIILDTAPLLLVSDTLSLLPLSDLIVYVTRAQYSDNKILPFIREMYSRENMPPFGMVLNGLIASASSSGYGYGYRYSYKYRYSYTYKYNYGYGYGYGRDKE